MLRTLVLFIIALTMAGCASTTAPSGPRLRTSYAPEQRQQLDTGELVMICLAGLALDIAVSNAADHGDEDVPVAEIVCESAQLSR